MTKEQVLKMAANVKKAVAQIKEVWEEGEDKITQDEYLEWIRTDHKLLIKASEALVVGWMAVKPDRGVDVEISERFDAIHEAIEKLDLKKVHELEMSFFDFVVRENDMIARLAEENEVLG